MKRSAAMFVTLAVMAGSTLAAQESTYRRSGWFSLGAGASTLALTCPPCLANDNIGPFVYARAGGTIDNHWTGAIDFSFRPRSQSGRTTRTYLFSAAAYFYPWLDSGLNFNGGGGGMFTTETGTGEDISMNGLVFRLGAAYDHFLSEGLALSPFVTYYRGRGITGKRNRVVFATPNLGVDIVQFGVTITKP